MSSQNGLEFARIGGVSFLIQLVVGIVIGNLYIILQGSPHPNLELLVPLVVMPIGGLIAVMRSEYARTFEGIRFAGLFLAASVIPVPLMIYGLGRFLYTKYL